MHWLSRLKMTESGIPDNPGAWLMTVTVETTYVIKNMRELVATWNSK